MIIALAACVMARVAPLRTAHATDPDFALGHAHERTPGVVLGMVQGVRERVEITLTPVGPEFRVVDIATGTLLADSLTQSQLAARFPHLDPAGDVAAPVLMFAEDRDTPIGW